MAERYTAAIYAVVPERRFWHKLIRRKTRREVLFMGIPTAFTLNRNAGSASECTLTITDTLEALMSIETKVLNNG